MHWSIIVQNISFRFHKVSSFHNRNDIPIQFQDIFWISIVSCWFLPSNAIESWILNHEWYNFPFLANPLVVAIISWSRFDSVMIRCVEIMWSRRDDSTNRPNQMLTSSFWNKSKAFSVRVQVGFSRETGCYLRMQVGFSRESAIYFSNAGWVFERDRFLVFECRFDLERDRF